MQHYFTIQNNFQSKMNAKALKYKKKTSCNKFKKERGGPAIAP